MQYNPADAKAVLVRTPAVFRVMLTGLGSEWIGANEGGESWSPFDVLGHLVHGERADWIPRVKIILEQGESRPFDPFDRSAQFEESKGKDLEELLDEFETLRRDNLEALEGLELEFEDYNRTGTHPDLGTVTLRQLLSTWAVHDLGHIAQAARVLAKQYADEVGPWRAHVPVLDR